MYFNTINLQFRGFYFMTTFSVHYRGLNPESLVFENSKFLLLDQTFSSCKTEGNITNINILLERIHFSKGELHVKSSGIRKNSRCSRFKSILVRSLFLTLYLTGSFVKSVYFKIRLQFEVLGTFCIYKHRRSVK